MSSGGVSPGIVTLNAAMSACELTGQWQRAVDVLSRPPGLRTPDIISYSTAMAGSGASGQWPASLNLFGRARARKVRPNVITWNSVISACEESGQWELALLVFDQLPAATVIGVNAGIAAAGRGARWQLASHLVDVLERSPTLQPSIVSFNAAVSACGSSQRWRQVLGLTRDLSRCSLQPDAISMNFVAASLERRGHWVGASQLLWEAQRCGERLLGPEVATMGVAVDSSQRFGSASRAVGLLGGLQQEAPRNLRQLEGRKGRRRT
ncbi:unnamed protein product [Durusdinium trenchii]